MLLNFLSFPCVYSGPARKPPQSVLDQLRSLNDSLKIGQMLCRSRNPDFLLDIIQRQVYLASKTSVHC